MLIERIKRIMEETRNVLSTGELLDLGLSKTTLTNYVRKGLLVRCGHGLYRIPDAIEDDMFLISLRSKHIVFSHETALFLNGLSERTPFRHAVTIPSNAAIPASIAGFCKRYYIKQDLHRLGVIEKRTTLGNTVLCYSPERTVCDILRSRNRMDEETVIGAIRLYGDYKDKDLHTLGKYAEIFKVGKRVRLYMELLL